MIEWLYRIANIKQMYCYKGKGKKFYFGTSLNFINNYKLINSNYSIGGLSRRGLCTNVSKLSNIKDNTKIELANLFLNDLKPLNKCPKSILYCDLFNNMVLRNKFRSN